MAKLAVLSSSVKSGMQYGDWTVLEDARRLRPAGKNYTSWFAPCRCVCGTVREITASMLFSGHSKSCGCKRGEKVGARSKTHGGNGTRLYWVWGDMLTRCRCETNANWDGYGGRGIMVCQEWGKFEAFRDWALASGYGPGLQLDRVDNDGNYEPCNCRWTTRTEQMNNRRSNRLLEAFGERKTVSQWARDPRCVVNRNTLSKRVHYGWSAEKAMTTARRPYRD